MNTSRNVLVTIVAVSALAAAAQDLVDVKVNLPKPVYLGTPCTYVTATLEPAPFKDPDPIKAPKGATNLALHKPVTASGKPNFGDLAMVTDGVNTHEEKNVVELGPGQGWIQIDLGNPSTIYAIVLWHYYATERVYFDLIMQVSDDPGFKTDVTTVYNNDGDNSSAMGEGKDKEYVETYRGRVVRIPDGAQGRYVRLHCRGNAESDMTHYIEVEVIGLPKG